MPEETKSPTPPPGGEAASRPRRLPATRLHRRPKPAGPDSPFRGILPWLPSYKGSYGSGIQRSQHLPRAELHGRRSLARFRRSCRSLRDEEQFDYCVDITAVHYPKREKQFDLVWILYSFSQERAHARQDADRRRRSVSQSQPRSGRRRTGWSAKSSTCSGSSSTGIPT